MQIARVIGNIVSTIKNESLHARKLLIVQTLDADLKPKEQPQSGWLWPPDEISPLRPSRIRDFKAKLDEYRAASRALAGAAAGSDQAAIGAAMGRTGRACKSCHDKYQLEE